MRQDIRVAARRIVLIVVAVYLPFLAIHALCLTGYGWNIAGVELFLLVPLGALLILPFALVSLTFRRQRAKAAFFAFMSIALLASFIPMAKTAAAVRSYGFLVASERAAPLLSAIERHQRAQGFPPHLLDHLVPRYLAEIPSGLPPVEIITGDEARQAYGGNAWVLRANVPTGLINWDEFIYFPNLDYRGYGGSIERIGDWAHYHE